MDGTVVFFDGRERFAAMAGFERLIAHPSDHPGREPPYRLLVVDDQNGVAAGGALRTGAGAASPFTFMEPLRGAGMVCPAKLPDLG